VSSPLSRALLVAAPFLALLLATKLPSLRFEHREPDEVIYWTVAKNLGEHGRYTLRGAPFLSKLSRRMYDKPLFHHPPLYPALLVPFATRELRREAIAISVFGHALALFAVALIGVHLHARFASGEPPLRALWLPLLGATLDPVFVHVARKLWIDALVGGLAALAVALAIVGCARERRRAWLVASGALLGLAALAKLPGLLAAAPIALAVLLRKGPLRARLCDLACAAAPAALLLAPWLLTFFATFGTLTPSWVQADAETMRRFPMIAAAAAKPWHFYLAKLAVCAPLFVLGVVAFAWKRASAPRNAESWSLLAWIALGLVAFTLLGMRGHSYQLRYLAPLSAALYALPLALPLWHRRGERRSLRIAAALAIAWATAGAVPYLVNGRPDEFIGLAEKLGWLTL
jgi:4-amino-4-deoxy-L-arabinose transferase-like glycosyltransferase